MNHRQRSNEQKYQNRNPVQQFLLNRFLDHLCSWIELLNPESILDFGCGEGYFWKAMNDRGLRPRNVRGVDFSDEAIRVAREIVPMYRFSVMDLFDMDTKEEQFDLVMAIEVLEHLDAPEKYLSQLVRLCSGSILLSVPHEPWFRIGNLLRGRDVRNFGNHPDHRNHWNRASFANFLNTQMEVIEVRRVFPWLVAVGSPTE
jgi:2-polyprenyl-3-methyl-5-hydroxy-6-metoxy-1,4-benzoquinol methylase